MNAHHRGDSDADQDSTRIGFLRPALWLLLIISGAGNVITSLVDGDVIVDIAFGTVALVCVIALVTQHYRHRRTSAVPDARDH
ncbi:hypothetical protein ACFHYQ_21925 [Sphaerimonospora cavernae]|uniref:DUF2631 domain-containing protein n=1 Tax=Sphaerimonospora cavernae TaxID=1740611 RepID=A0ABV6U9U4_9ACTN